eukprot:11053979-Alexandrium_andersonii.AAC.1
MSCPAYSGIFGGRSSLEAPENAWQLPNNCRTLAGECRKLLHAVGQTWEWLFAWRLGAPRSAAPLRT